MTSDPFAYTRGPRDANVVVCGEAWGANEEMTGKPFMGESGHELTKMLTESGFDPSSILYTNVVDARPPNNDIEEFFHGRKEGRGLGREFLGYYPQPVLREGIDKLYSLLDAVRPRLVVAVGNTPLWAIGGKVAKLKNRGVSPSGITKWRGSELPTLQPDRWPRTKLLSTYHPAAVLRQWSWRHITVHDLRRAYRESQYDGLIKPQWQFQVRPTLKEVIDRFDFLIASAIALPEGEYLALDGDIETRGGRIACIGIGWSLTEAICIPFQSVDSLEGYFSADEEVEVILALRALQCHSRIKMTFHNSVFDFTHNARDWGYMPNLGDDTMVKQHTIWPGLPKALYFCASMYCEHYWFWKDEGNPDDDKEWNPIDMPEDRLWWYNCQDLVRMRECNLELDAQLDKFDMWPQYEMQLAMIPVALDMMLRGIRIDRSRRARLQVELERALLQREEWLEFVLDHPFNCRSSPQMQALFYEDLNCKVIRNRQTGQPTCDNAALEEIALKYPTWRPIVENIQEQRSVNIFKTNFVEARLSDDHRIRCSVNTTGAHTFRWSMSKDVYGAGANLQTIPQGTEDK